jgi:hypothetical protein
MPRISVPGYTQPSPIPPPAAPGDPVDATRLVLRLQALERVLDDLPGQARRFARWRHRAAARAQEKEAVARGVADKEAAAELWRRHSQAAARGEKTRTKIIRCWPLRMGRPPGWRRKGGHEVHDVVLRTNGLALYALEGRDTS